MIIHYQSNNKFTSCPCSGCFSDACEYFATQLSPLGEDEREEWLEKVVDYIQKQSLNAPFVGKSLIESAILVTALCSFVFVDI